MAWFPRRERRNALRNAAVDCARRGWFVVPGTYIVRDGRTRGRHARAKRGDRPLRCSCKLTICPAPGEHPAAPDWQVQATNEPQAVAWWWSGRDTPNVVLPTGWSFDALHVASALGTRILGRFQDPYVEIPTGPVVRGSSGDWWFLVAPALDDDEPWLDRLRALGIRHRGVGSFVLAPPSTGGAAGGLNWVVAPSAATVRMPTVEQFLAMALGAGPRSGTGTYQQQELRSGGRYRPDGYPEYPEEHPSGEHPDQRQPTGEHPRRAHPDRRYQDESGYRQRPDTSYQDSRRGSSPTGARYPGQPYPDGRERYGPAQVPGGVPQGYLHSANSADAVGVDGVGVDGVSRDERYDDRRDERYDDRGDEGGYDTDHDDDYWVEPDAGYEEPWDGGQPRRRWD